MQREVVNSAKIQYTATDPKTGKIEFISDLMTPDASIAFVQRWISKHPENVWTMKVYKED